MARTGIKKKKKKNRYQLTLNHLHAELVIFKSLKNIFIVS